MRYALKLRRTFSRVAPKGAALAFAALSLIAPTHAAPTTVGEFFTESKSFGCGAANSCVLTFSTTPGSDMVVQTVGCRIVIGSSASVTSLYIAGYGQSHPLDFGASTVIGGVKVLTTHDPALVPFPAGKVPRIGVNTSNATTIQFFCAISGILIPVT